MLGIKPSLPLAEKEPSPVPDTTRSNSAIIAAYRAKTPASAEWAERARQSFPSGITHDSRHLSPYALYVERGQGGHKWDADGNEYIDYFGGHGALILGHNHPKVLEAMQKALADGTHFGASHPREVLWAEQIRRMVPCAERVRFTSSGTEATMMALRLARAYTGRDTVIRFRTHFHGWNDHMASGQAGHMDGTPTPGVVSGITAATVLVDPNDRAGVEQAFAGHSVAGVILEPTGSSTGMVPVAPGFLAFLREKCDKHGAVLIFDEVVTGFRVSPGGAQQASGVTPDLGTFAKIIAGGLPGGAICGKEAILELLDFEKAASKGFEKIGHQGTYNANPVSAAAGLAALEIIEKDGICEQANAYGTALRSELNQVLRAEGVPWAVYGDYSTFHVFTNPKARADVGPDAFNPLDYDYSELKANAPGAVQKLRIAMILNGVDIMGWPGGNIAAVHTDEDRAKTVEAFAASLQLMKAEGDL
jgi:glutamate-1-semialdehyde 2,1-aminomutase